MRNKNPDKRVKYMREVFASEDSLLREIREALEKTSRPIQIGADEGKFLQFLVAIARPKKILEIGTLAGYSTLWLAKSLPDGGYIYTLERDKDNAETARANFARSKAKENIILVEGEAVKMLGTLDKEGPFDMVFIDADKINYPVYLDLVEKNVRKGGLIIGDNTFLFGTVYEDDIPEGSDIAPKTHAAMKEFNKRLSNPKQYISFMFPSSEGMTVAQKIF